MFKKIVIIEPINMLDVHKKMFNEYALEVVAYDNIPTSDDEKIKRIADADCLLVSYTSSIDEYVINKAPNLKYIGRFMFHRENKNKKRTRWNGQVKIKKKRVTKSPEKVTAEYFKTK